MKMKWRDGRPLSSMRKTQEPLSASFASTARIRVKMQAQQARNTKPELALRHAAHALGLRYRVDRAPLNGLRRRADLVFGPVKLAVYVDGCFWHVCPQHATWPRANAAWWRAKLEGNQARDRDTDARLTEAGWHVAHVWEHEDPTAAAKRIAQLVNDLRRDS
jgi:DNA mismatch endonuclease, patch repair protein